MFVLIYVIIKCMCQDYEWSHNFFLHFKGICMLFEVRVLIPAFGYYVIPRDCNETRPGNWCVCVCTYIRTYTPANLHEISVPRSWWRVVCWLASPAAQLFRPSCKQKSWITFFSPWSSCSVCLVFFQFLMCQRKMTSLGQYIARVFFLVVFLCQELKGNSLGTLGHWNIFTSWPPTRPQTWTKTYFLFLLTP